MKTCPFCGAKDHGAVTKPTVTCTRHLWAVNATLQRALKEYCRDLEYAFGGHGQLTGMEANFYGKAQAILTKANP